MTAGRPSPAAKQIGFSFMADGERFSVSATGVVVVPSGDDLSGQEQPVNFENALTEVLPPEALLTEIEDKRPYECDGLSAYQQVPRVVVMPETRKQVEDVVKICAEYDVPIVARGAGTGLSGGALPLADGCLMSLAKFNRIVEIDAENLVAVVEPGVRNIAVSEAVAAHGLYYAPDPSSQIACSIGGNVAENSGKKIGGYVMDLCVFEFIFLVSVED